ncbi:hypothetical protein A0H81_04961 [Grifola frondosa]|uniref:Uncharacterized protein n=1 Tax=Grifola frondosa TaxID=5627 RepID=A0A1C7MGP6_GRIFR|nr:hypothetical protein A0H81_04961 [Grifola frondosa]
MSSTSTKTHRTFAKEAINRTLADTNWFGGDLRRAVQSPICSCISDMSPRYRHIDAVSVSRSVILPVIPVFPKSMNWYASLNMVDTTKVSAVTYGNASSTPLLLLPSSSFNLSAECAVFAKFAMCTASVVMPIQCPTKLFSVTALVANSARIIPRTVTVPAANRAVGSIVNILSNIHLKSPAIVRLVLKAAEHVMTSG